MTSISTYARDMVTEMRAVLCGTKTASASVFTREVGYLYPLLGVQQGRSNYLD